MEHLISKYLKKELSEVEAKELKVWLEKDALNRKVFENIVGQWRLTSEDIESTKSRVLARVMSSSEELTIAQPVPSRHWMSYAVRIAAILVLGVGLTLIWMTNAGLWNDDVTVASQEVYIEKEAINGQKLTFELPDGSIVKLNAGSKLIYPKEFANQRREVSLTGEAFFDVARDERKPFRISSNDVTVQVLGTSFNVRSYPDESNIEVAVKTGKVAVSSNKTQEKVVLTPAQIAYYSTKDQTLNSGEIKENDMAIFGWVDQNLVLEDASFDVILTKLSRWYGVEFNVEQKHGAQKRFTANFKNPSLTRVMESLSFAYEFKYEINGKRVTIY